MRPGDGVLVRMIISKRWVMKTSHGSAGARDALYVKPPEKNVGLVKQPWRKEIGEALQRTDCRSKLSSQRVFICEALRNTVI